MTDSLDKPESLQAPDADFYQHLRERIRVWLAGKGAGFRHAQVVLLVPDLLHLLCKLIADPRIPTREKAKLGIAIAYIVSPIDLLPEFLVGPSGYLDDVAAASHALNALINAGHGEVAREHWAGEGDLLQVVQNVLAKADELLGPGRWKRVRDLFDRT